MDRSTILRAIGQLNMVLDEYRSRLWEKEADEIHNAIRALQKLYSRT